MKKRLLAILMIGFMLAGCSSQPAADVDNMGTGDVVKTEQPSASNEEPTEPPHEHAYTESTTTQAACETEGVKTFICECGDTYTEAIPAMGHVFEEVADSALAVTCTIDGKETDTKCSVCESLVEGAVIPATGHSFGEYVYNNDATTKADGTETATCSVCGEKTSRTKEGTKRSYDGYDEFGNGFIWGADGYKYFDAPNPYPVFETIWLSDTEAIYYGPSRWPQFIQTICEEMAQRNGVHWTAMAAGATEIGYYNGEFVLRERIYLKNN